MDWECTRKGIQMADNKATGLAVNEVSNISRWYDNRSVFITGATGFMGKVLVEKLLNSCPGINKIYLLLRSKRDISPEKRLEQLKQTPIFDYIKKYYPQRMDKLVVISGDIVEPEMKISKEDQKILCSNVSVVFHSAATVKFDEVINLSVAMNMMGTRWLIQLCQKMPKLEALVHVSTAYCNCDLSYVEEKVYPPPKDITKTIKYMECLDNDMLTEMTPRIIGNRPNTYTFTKAMAENILLKESSDLPVVIIRPSIVTASYQSPMPGWVDNLNGPTGLIAGGGKGLLRSLYCNVKMQADIIPVDICINAMIISAWSTAKKKNDRMTVYHVTTGMLNPLKWGDLEKMSLLNLRRHPFNDILWYPGGSFKTNKLHHSLCHGLFHVLPAYLIDYSYILVGRKPPVSMIKVQRKIQAAIEALTYFITNEWTFASGNIVKMQTMLSEADKKIFDIDTAKIQWGPYMENYVKGVRKYILKEDDKDLPKARQHMRKMYIIHCITKVLFIMAMIRFVLGNLYIMRKFGFGIITYAFQLIKSVISLPIK